jgi:AraC-like DNA-binding protein
MHSHFPRLEIGPLSEYRADDIMISRFAQYLREHQNLIFPHRHSFYQIVLFTSGGGSHSIDFNRFDVQALQMYFMVPGQIHTWEFEGEMEGYVVNFSESFFRSFLLQSDYLDSFSFFDGDSSHAVVQLPETMQGKIVGLFEELLFYPLPITSQQADLIRVLLLQLFLTIEQSDAMSAEQKGRAHKPQVIRDFQKLINQHYTKLRLPGEYAPLLHITPNHLNALCKEHLGMQAGALIRNRITLEAKRLLTNADLTISQISYALNFSDNSYFTKFFKKETGVTPEGWRFWEF